MNKKILAHALVMVMIFTGMLIPNIAIKADDETPEEVTLLFVQTSRDVSFGKGTVTLKGVSPNTLFFSDRPQRIAGHWPDDVFLAVWYEGEDSFAKDPPNAVLSIFTEDEMVDVVVVLQNSRYTGQDLTYDIDIIDGELPEEGGPASLFIDTVGRPMTPVSVAGVARRTTRRNVAKAASGP